MVRIDATADDSFAAIRARNRFGIAIAAMIRMMATTISNSISEKPFCFRIQNCPLPLGRVFLNDHSLGVCTIRIKASSYESRDLKLRKSFRTKRKLLETRTRIRFTPEARYL